MEKNKWVKPFSTQLSCLDTISGECIRDKTMYECSNICENASYCFNGYHVKLPNESQSYCLPLNALTHIDNIDLFDYSLIDPMNSKIFSSNLGVEITPFTTRKKQNINLMDSKKKYLTQDKFYFLTYFDESLKKILYLKSDLTFTTDETAAVSINIIPKKRTLSLIVTTSIYIKNGYPLLLNVNDKTDNILYFDKDTKEVSIIPIQSLLTSSGIFADDFYYLQFITDYPFENQDILISDKFAIRWGQIPIINDFYYMTVDPSTYTFIPKQIKKTDMEKELKHFKMFQLIENVQNIELDTDFESSQKKYLLDNFSNDSLNNHDNHNIILISSIICIIVCIILLIIILIFQRK